MGLEQKGTEEKQRFKKRRGKLVQRMDALKRGWAGIPLQNYDVYMVAGVLFIYFYKIIICFTLTIVILQQHSYTQ